MVNDAIIQVLIFFYWKKLIMIFRQVFLFKNINNFSYKFIFVLYLVYI